MTVRVIYKDKGSGTIEESQLAELIAGRKIVAFCRSTEWVTIGLDPVRGLGGNYAGPERRIRPGEAAMPSDTRDNSLLIPAED